MQSRMPIYAAVIAAVLAIILLNFYIGGLRESLEPVKADVMVASHDLRAGTTLEDKDVMRATRVKDSLPKLAIPWSERLNFVGQQIGSDVQSQDYVMSSYFGAARLVSQRPSDKVDARSGQRLFTLPVSSDTSLEGGIRAGDRIDILITYSLAETANAGVKGAAAPRPRVVTTPLLENAYVLYTGPYGSSARTYSSITLLVSPDEAKVLIWAQRLGTKLNILLRNPKDVQLTDRAYIAGDETNLQALSHQQMRLEDVIKAPSEPKK